MHPLHNIYFRNMLQLHYKSYGTGTKHLIILHGFLGSLDNWHTLAGQWGENGIHVWSLDQRNHGKSPHKEVHSLQLMADDLVDFMKQHQILEATLLGHSMGGKVAMLAALQNPHLFNGIIVADIAPKAYKRGHDDVFEALFNTNLHLITSRKEAEEAMKPYLGDIATRNFILKSLERTSENAYQWKFNLLALHEHYDEIRKPIESNAPYNKPVLFLKGEQSAYIKPEQDWEQIIQLFPNALLHTVGGAAHWLHAEKPAEVFEQVLHFVNQIGIVHS